LIAVKQDKNISNFPQRELKKCSSAATSIIKIRYENIFTVRI
jgi:hypothetical protein